jgi:hypothetical protein
MRERERELRDERDERERDRETDRETEREMKEREIEIQTDRQRERERERERESPYYPLSACMRTSGRARERSLESSVSGERHTHMYPPPHMTCILLLNVR